MKITNVIATPLYSRRQTGSLTPHVILQFETDEGLVGLGEMSDLGHSKVMYDVQDVRDSLAYAVVGRDPEAWRPLCNEIQQRFAGQSLVREGAELAILDLAAKAKGQTVGELLGGGYVDKIKVCYPIFRMMSMDEVEENVARVEMRMNQGHDLFRLYCGGCVEADDAFLSAVRDQWGDAFHLKSLDFSGRLPWKKTLAALDVLLQYDPILCESICDRRDPAGQYEVRSRITKPISEHIHSLNMAFEFAKNRYVDIFNLSLAGCGGMTQAIHMAKVAEAAGISCLVGTTQELSIGVAGQAIFGSLLTNLDYPSDMTGGLLYEDDVVKERIRYENGYVLVPEGPGLGMEIDQEALAALAKPLSSVQGGH